MAKTAPTQHVKNASNMAKEYWYAYVRIGGKLTKKYLGKCTDLTLARLEQIAQELWLGSRTKTRHAGISVLPRSSDALVPLANGTAGLPASAYWRHHLIRQQDSYPDGQKTISMISHLPTDPLLTTKLRVPRPRPHLLHRPRLIRQLQRGLERILILLSAPAGSGKSTLLADWLTSSTFPVAWLSLETQDNRTGTLLLLFACCLADL